jgi:hypothetical protein
MSSPDWAALFAAASDEVAADRRALIADAAAGAHGVQGAADLFGIHRQAVQRLRRRADEVYASRTRLAAAFAPVDPIPTFATRTIAAYSEKMAAFNRGSSVNT